MMGDENGNFYNGNCPTKGPYSKAGREASVK